MCALSHHTAHPRIRVSKCNWSDDEDSMNSKLSRTLKFPHIEDITDLIQKWLNKTSQQFPNGLEYSGLGPSDSPLSGEISKLCFSKFIKPTFKHYSRTFDLLLHLHQY